VDILSLVTQMKPSPSLVSLGQDDLFTVVKIPYDHVGIYIFGDSFGIN
jgi:hypothetical protein